MSTSFPPAPVYGTNQVPYEGYPSNTGILNLVTVFDDFLFTPDDRAHFPPSMTTFHPGAMEEYYDDDEDESGDRDNTDAEGGSHNKPRKRIRPSIHSLNPEQKYERREKNKEHAKKSRVRKKFLLDSLQQSVWALEKENEKLRAAVREHLHEEAESVLAHCAKASAGSIIAADPSTATKTLDNPDFSLVKALQTTEQTFLITDPSLPDNPIVYASQGFIALTGYKLNEILGRNCRFLQGPETDPRAIERIRHAVDKGEDITEVILNYRADGSTFWNQLFVAGLRDIEGVVVNFLGVQCQVSEAYAHAYLKEQEGKRNASEGESSKG